MTTTETRAEERQSSRPPISTVLWFMAVVSFIGTLALWWLGELPGEPEFEVGREVFGNIPDLVVAVFYVLVAAFIAVAIGLFALRAANWERGTWERRSGLWKRRLRRFLDGVSMRTVAEDPAAGVMHSLIYWGFVVLFLGTVTLEIDHLLPVGLKFLHGTVYQGYSLILDIAAVAFLAGIVWAAVRRYGVKPWRIRSKSRPEDAWILILLGTIGVTGLLTEAARISLVGRPDFEVWSVVGYPLSFIVPQSIASGFHQIMWVAHAVAFFAFLVFLPVTKLRHMFTTPVNLALAAKDRPKGAMKEMPNLMEATDIESVGAGFVGEFTWKQLLDTDACTICGRCTAVCPAAATGKPLDPREIVLKLGTVAAMTADPKQSPPVGVDAAITVSSDSVFELVTPEEIWACTTCRACDEACPADIEIVDKILDMRRYKALMEAEFPSELGKAYVSMENSSNVYGVDQKTRGDWTDALDFEVKRLGEPGVTAEYLMWVGCAGSFDDRNRNVTIATARLLHKAGVDFGILGAKELCTGDPARRTGNEYVFQGLALQNIATLNELGVETIVTQCPHCFNTLGNEYPQFGGNYTVMHHSEMLSRLVEEGRLVPESTGETIVFHDPCYLGRHNDTFLAPRTIVDAAGVRVEMKRNGTNSFCCGAGGGKFWFEEHTGKKVNIDRTEEAVATGADIVATGCPFCYVMMDDGVKEIGEGERVIVQDVSMLLDARTR
ncbi:MAG TPA: heterodisulfide reductase-related iron-sulfur binding cluster [Acidimicrobiia bacterium]|nr:heterodisulfide reductase-related iron-sulfur binding cluster [Acidimicrobiia bacterium]